MLFLLFWKNVKIQILSYIQSYIIDYLHTYEILLTLTFKYTDIYS